MNRLLVHQPSLLSLTKLFAFGISQLPFLRAAPLLHSPFAALEEPEGKDSDDPTLWIYLAVAVGLVLLGGAFAGLTIALMGQDEIYLQVIKTSGEGSERKNAARVLRLLGRGKHWVLVTLLLSNVITNETLPIVLDRSLGGGWPAVLGSTVLIVIFGEVIPQSICVRYGLPIGAWMSPLVLALMYILAPVAWPTAKLLDWLLGEDHGTVYKKAGLKTLVTLHKTLGSAGEQLNSDEVTIISAVLDLKEKPVGRIMTPMDDVFTMSADTILDDDTMNTILAAGYSRVPIHVPDKPYDFVGMLLVKMLITYDPEDCKPVHDFALATLPETRPETSCLDIVNFFQEGKSHMVLVSENPAGDSGALGVVTLEDVIEELIGEEIIDESDVFIDVHKAIRRMHPAPRTRVPKGAIVTDSANNTGTGDIELERKVDGGTDAPSHDAVRRVATQDPPPRNKANSLDLSSSPKTTFLMRRTSGASNIVDRQLISKRADMPELREHLKHLGPSNLASRPRTTRSTTVKIKPGASDAALKTIQTPPRPIVQEQTSMEGGIGEDLIQSAGKDAKDGVHAVQVGYGSIERPRTADTANRGTYVRSDSLQEDVDPRDISGSSVQTSSTIGSLPSKDASQSPLLPIARAARSGSITYNIIESRGIKKAIVETNSNSEDATDGQNGESASVAEGAESQDRMASKRKRRRKRRRDNRSESTPLLGDRDG